MFFLLLLLTRLLRALLLSHLAWEEQNRVFPNFDFISFSTIVKSLISLYQEWALYKKEHNKSPNNKKKYVSGKERTKSVQEIKKKWARTRMRNQRGKNRVRTRTVKEIQNRMRVVKTETKALGKHYKTFNRCIFILSFIVQKLRALSVSIRF